MCRDCNIVNREEKPRDESKILVRELGASFDVIPRIGGYEKGHA